MSMCTGMYGDIYTNVAIPSMLIHTLHMYTHIQTCTHVHTHTNTHVHTHTNTHVHTYAHIICTCNTIMIYNIMLLITSEVKTENLVQPGNTYVHLRHMYMYVHVYTQYVHVHVCTCNAVSMVV